MCMPSPSSCASSLYPIEGEGTFRGVLHVRTLLASSGYTLGHGPTTRTHACRWPPKRERGRPRHTHTHTIYAVRRVYSAGAHPLASLPSPVSHRLASASLAVSEPNPPPSPTPLFPRISLRKRHWRGGGHSTLLSHATVQACVADSSALAGFSTSSSFFCKVVVLQVGLLDLLSLVTCLLVGTKPFKCSRFTRRN